MTDRGNVEKSVEINHYFTNSCNTVSHTVFLSTGTWVTFGSQISDEVIFFFLISHDLGTLLLIYVIYTLIYTLMSFHTVLYIFFLYMQ